MMRRLPPFLIVLAFALLLALSFLLYRPLTVRPPARETSMPAPASVPPPAAVTPTRASDLAAEAQHDAARVHATIRNFMTLVKEPRRPPLGDNRDITRALTGENPLGEALVSNHDDRVVDGQLVDRWGTPYHFHPRAPNTIDVRSAGPDRSLFTDDDVTWPVVPAAPSL